MAEPMYKLLLFLKRRPDVSPEAFREHYENVHSKLVEKHMVGARRYIRRYVQPLRDSGSGEAEPLAFDVITEVWFDSPAVLEKVVEALEGGQVAEEIVADEERFLDRSKSRYATVVEMESDLPRPSTQQARDI